MVTQKSKRFKVVVWQLQTKFSDIFSRLRLDPLPVRRLGLARLQGWTPPPLSNEFRVGTESAEWLGELTHVKLYYVCDHIRLHVRQIDEVGTILKGLTQLFDARFDTRHSVNALDVYAPLVNFGHAPTYQRRNLCANLQQVVAKRNAEGGHFAGQPFLATHQVDGFQTLFVRR